MYLKKFWTSFCLPNLTYHVAFLSPLLLRESCTIETLLTNFSFKILWSSLAKSSILCAEMIDWGERPPTSNLRYMRWIRTGSILLSVYLPSSGIRCLSTSQRYCLIVWSKLLTLPSNEIWHLATHVRMWNHRDPNALHHNSGMRRIYDASLMKSKTNVTMLRFYWPFQRA